MACIYEFLHLRSCISSCFNPTLLHSFEIILMPSFLDGSWLLLQFMDFTVHCGGVDS